MTLDLEATTEKGVYIEDLQPGDIVKDSVFVVKNASEQMSKAGSPFISLQLTDRTGVKDARKFSITDTERTTLLTAKFVCVNGRVENNPKYADQLIIDRVVAVQPVDEIPFLKPLMADAIKHQEAFSRLLKSVNEPSLAALLRHVFAGETWSLFKRAVAAASNHHEYPGGLLEHTLEVATLCDRACSVLPCLRRDLLVTSAMLHDIGKLEEMEHGVLAGQYTASGNLVGHIVSGAMRIAQTAARVDGFPPSLLDTLTHMILSHHGLPEYGAAKKPAMAEAFVLSECDQMSARVHMCRVGKERASQGQLTVKSHGDYIFVGDIEFVRSDTVSTVPSFAVLRSFKVLGSVAAGDPNMSEGNPECETREAVPPAAGADYLLKVTGDSMLGAGIFPGDLVFVRKQADAVDGQIVVACVPDEGTVVKRLKYMNGSPAKLVSESNTHPPILLADGIAVEGIVTGIIREYAA